MFLFVTSGIWPRGADGTDINNCARSHDNQLMVSADDFGKVNMYRYPCSQPRVSIYILVLADFLATSIWDLNFQLRWPKWSF